MSFLIALGCWLLTPLPLSAQTRAVVIKDATVLTGDGTKIKRGTGSCSEYTFAFIALCRAAGLPARYQGSVVVRGDDASIDDAFHRWAEIYLPNYGWIPVDASRGDAKSPADQARGIGELANRFLITTRGGGGSEYLAWTYNSFAQYQATGYCKIEEENPGFWEPLKGEEK